MEGAEEGGEERGEVDGAQQAEQTEEVRERVLPALWPIEAATAMSARAQPMLEAHHPRVPGWHDGLLMPSSGLDASLGPNPRPVTTRDREDVTIHAWPTFSAIRLLVPGC